MRSLLLFLSLLLLEACVSAKPAGKPQVLIFSHATGYRHSSIQTARPALQRLAETIGAEAVLSEDPAIFSIEGLKGFRAILLLSTATDRKRPESEWLIGARREALQAFLRSGRGVLAVHAAADSHPGWGWYGRMIGARFDRHPPGTPAGRLSVVDRRHPSTAALPETISHTDEWYYFDNYEPGSRLLVTLDPASIGQAGGGPNPISWAREYEGGRVFYTALGHTPESYAQPFFLDHLSGALRWVLRLSD